MGFCPVQVMRHHFCNKHWSDLVCIPTEHPTPHPKCPHCGLQLPPNRITPTHFQTKSCAAGMERIRCRESTQTCQQAATIHFHIKGEQIKQVQSFQHLGWIIHEENSDWSALFHDLKKARKCWGMLARILDKDSATFQAKGMFHGAIIQSVLLCGVETWMVAPAMMRVLKSFHHRVAQRISGMMTHRAGDNWVCPPIGDAATPESWPPPNEGLC